MLISDPALLYMGYISEPLFGVDMCDACGIIDGDIWIIDHKIRIIDIKIPTLVDYWGDIEIPLCEYGW